MKSIQYSKLQQHLLFNFLIPSAFFILALWLMPVASAFQFDTDEGQELIKAVLYSQGFELYTEIWSDQAPLLTIFLHNWFQIFGESVFAARILILSLATVLVWSFCQTLRICLGNLPAIIGTAMLGISCNFLRLSVSVMIGIPSLTFAMLSVYTLVLYQHNKKTYLLLFSGAFLAISLQIKMFTIFLIPLIVLQILGSKIIVQYQDDIAILILFRCKEYWFREQGTGKGERRDVPHESGKLYNNLSAFQKPFFLFGAKSLFLKMKIWKILFPILLWLFSLAIVFILMGLRLNSASPENMFLSHFQGDLKAGFPTANSLSDLITMFLQEIDYTLLATVGIFVAIRKNNWVNIFPVMWLACTIILLLNHKPLWYHHYLLISIPLTWLASYGVSLALKHCQNKNSGKKFVLIKLKQLSLPIIAFYLVCFALLVTPVKLIAMQVENHHLWQKTQINKQTLEEISKYKEDTSWLLTDVPIYGFYAGINIPPEIAVLSRKRFASGVIDQKFISQLMEKYHPEQIVIDRFPRVGELLEIFAKEKYKIIPQSNVQKHYILKKITKVK